MNRNSLKQHMVEGPVLTYDFTLHSRVRDHTNLHEFGGVLGQPLDTFLWALTIPWSRLLALNYCCIYPTLNHVLDVPFGDEASIRLLPETS